MIYWKPYQLLPVYFLDHRPSRRIAQCAGATECRQVAASGVLRDEMRADRGDCVTRHLVITRYFFINNSVLGRCLSRVLLCVTEAHGLSSRAQTCWGQPVRPALLLPGPGRAWWLRTRSSPLLLFSSSSWNQENDTNSIFIWKFCLLRVKEWSIRQAVDLVL